MRKCEEMLKFVQSSKDSRLELAGGSRLASRQMMHTSELQDKKSSLTILFAHGLNSRLSQVASQLCFEKPNSSHSILTLV